VFGLVADAALAGPEAGAMAKAGEGARGQSGTAITAVEFFPQRFGLPFKDAVGGDTQSYSMPKNSQN